MQQKLILPLNRTLVTASMGNAAYRAKFGFPGSKSYWSPHLHVEADTDVRYPRYSPTFTPSGEILFGRAAGATAATLRDCLDYLYRKTSAPDRQTYKTAGAPYVDQKDFAIPVLPE